MMSQTSFEFHDSEVQSAVWSGNTLRILFSAAHAQHDGAAGYLSGVILVFEEAVCSGDLPTCMGALAEGELTVAGERLRRIPIPLPAQGPVMAEIRFKAGTLLSVQAVSLTCLGPDEPRFVESLAC